MEKLGNEETEEYLFQDSLFGKEKMKLLNPYIWILYIFTGFFLSIEILTIIISYYYYPLDLFLSFVKGIIIPFIFHLIVITLLIYLYRKSFVIVYGYKILITEIGIEFYYKNSRAKPLLTVNMIKNIALIPNERKPFHLNERKTGYSTIEIICPDYCERGYIEIYIRKIDEFLEVLENIYGSQKWEGLFEDRT